MQPTPLLNYRTFSPSQKPSLHLCIQSFPLPTPGNQLCMLYESFSSSKTWYEWSHTECNLCLWLPSLSVRFLKFIRVICGLAAHSFCYSSISMCGYATSFTHSAVARYWDVSSLKTLGNMHSFKRGGERAWVHMLFLNSNEKVPNFYLIYWFCFISLSRKIQFPNVITNIISLPENTSRCLPI